MRYGRLAGIACLVGAALLAPPASAAPFTTVQRTIQDCDGDNLLEFTFGEEHVPFPPPPDQSDDPCSREAGEGQDLRLPPRASIINFLQLSDFQMVDEESPGRVEWLDATQRIPRLQPFSAAYRPQESLTTQVTEAMVRQARNSVSPVTGKQLDLTILTGDNADSQQYNETRWFIDILDGTDTAENPDPEMESPERRGRDRKVDPDSGIPEASPCDATPGTRYDGVRDDGQRPKNGVPAFDGGYYEPDSSTGEREDGDGYTPFRRDNAEETGRDVMVRDFPGLFERANEPFEAIGLDMPWYSAFGNHDALVQGNSPDAYLGPFGTSGETFNALYHGIVTGCLKVMQPSGAVLTVIQGLVEDIEDLREGGVDPSEQPKIDELTGEILKKAQDTLFGACDPNDPSCEFEGSVEFVPRDDRRCFLAKDDNALNAGLAPGPCTTGSWIRQHFRTTGTPVGHGFAPSDPELCEKYAADEDACERAAADVGPGLGRPPQAIANHDGYYSFVPKPGLRFVVLDTVTDECGSVFCSEGSVDDAQFDWLKQQIEAAAGATPKQYVVVFSHHTLRTTRFPSTDASEYAHPEDPGTPGVHYGQRVDRRSPGNPQNPTDVKTLEELYCDYPNLIAHVAGHEHENYVEEHDCDDPVSVPMSTRANPYFWHISTAAHIDWPQQSRMIELVDIDGDMSFVLTMLDHDGPANPGGHPPGKEEQGQAPDDIVRLAGIGREIAYNDYQGDPRARGSREDRNVILPTDRPAPASTGNP